jgi:hypothetical protein
MNERQIALNGVHRNGQRYVTLLNFANFDFLTRKSSDLKENREANEVIQMKIINEPCL